MQGKTDTDAWEIIREEKLSYVIAARLSNWIYDPDEKKLTARMVRVDGKNYKVEYTFNAVIRGKSEFQQVQVGSVRVTITPHPENQGKSTEWIFFVFRGTADPQDWVYNLSSTIDWVSFKEEGVGVHAGWESLFSGATSLATKFVDRLINVVKKLQENKGNKSPGIRIIFTGHSLGGGLARIAILKMKRFLELFEPQNNTKLENFIKIKGNKDFLLKTDNGQEKNKEMIKDSLKTARCITFAAPNPFTRIHEAMKKKSKYNHLNQRQTRMTKQWLERHTLNFINANDIVPRLPNELGFLQRVGVPRTLFGGYLSFEKLRKAIPMCDLYESFSQQQSLSYGKIWNTSQIEKATEIVQARETFTQVNSANSYLNELEKNKNDPVDFLDTLKEFICKIQGLNKAKEMANTLMKARVQKVQELANELETKEKQAHEQTTLIKMLLKVATDSLQDLPKATGEIKKAMGKSSEEEALQRASEDLNKVMDELEERTRLLSNVKNGLAATLEPAKPNTAPEKVLARIRQALTKAKDVLAVAEIASVDNKPALAAKEQEVMKDLQNATQGLKTATQKRLQPQKALNDKKQEKETETPDAIEVAHAIEVATQKLKTNIQSAGPDEEQALQRASKDLKEAMGEIQRTIGETKKTMDEMEEPTRFLPNVKDTPAKADDAVEMLAKAAIIVQEKLKKVLVKAQDRLEETMELLKEVQTMCDEAKIALEFYPMQQKKNKFEKKVRTDAIDKLKEMKELKKMKDSKKVMALLAKAEKVLKSSKSAGNAQTNQKEEYNHEKNGFDTCLDTLLDKFFGTKTDKKLVPVSYIPGHPDNKYSTASVIASAFANLTMFQYTLIHFLFTRATYPFLVPFLVPVEQTTDESRPAIETNKCGCQKYFENCTNCLVAFFSKCEGKRAKKDERGFSILCICKWLFHENAWLFYKCKWIFFAVLSGHAIVHLFDVVINKAIFSDMKCTSATDFATVPLCVLSFFGGTHWFLERRYLRKNDQDGGIKQTAVPTLLMAVGCVILAAISIMRDINFLVQHMQALSCTTEHLFFKPALDFVTHLRLHGIARLMCFMSFVGFLLCRVEKFLLDAALWKRFATTCLRVPEEYFKTEPTGDDAACTNSKTIFYNSNNFCLFLLVGLAIGLVLGVSKDETPYQKEVFFVGALCFCLIRIGNKQRLDRRDILPIFGPYIMLIIVGFLPKFLPTFFLDLCEASATENTPEPVNCACLETPLLVSVVCLFCAFFYMFDVLARCLVKTGTTVAKQTESHKTKRTTADYIAAFVAAIMAFYCVKFSRLYLFTWLDDNVDYYFRSPLECILTIFGAACLFDFFCTETFKPENEKSTVIGRPFQTIVQVFFAFLFPMIVHLMVLRIGPPEESALQDWIQYSLSRSSAFRNLFGDFPAESSGTFVKSIVTASYSAMRALSASCSVGYFAFLLVGKNPRFDWFRIWTALYWTARVGHLVKPSDNGNFLVDCLMDFLAGFIVSGSPCFLFFVLQVMPCSACKDTRVLQAINDHSMEEYEQLIIDNCVQKPKETTDANQTKSDKSNETTVAKQIESDNHITPREEVSGSQHCFNEYATTLVGVAVSIIIYCLMNLKTSRDVDPDVTSTHV